MCCILGQKDSIHFWWCPENLPDYALRTAAFQAAPRRRLSLSKFQIGYPIDHNYTYFGAQYTACILALSSFVLPLPGLHVDIPTSLLALGFHSESLTLAGWDFHPLGNNAKFLGLTPNPNGSDLNLGTRSEC